jgi:hypothetical protein
MVQLSAFARLLYIGMWNFAICDKGHLEDDSFRLKLQVLPMDDVDVDSLLDELMSLGRIERITVEGETYLWIRHLADHAGNQDRRWKTRCKACTPESSGSDAPAKLSEPRATTANHGQTQVSFPEHMQGKERKGKEGNKRSSSTAAPSTEKFDEFWRSYPRKVGKQAAAKAYARALKAATHERIMSGVEDYRIRMAGKDPQYVAHPATWLNGGRWEDEPDTPQQGGPRIPEGLRWANEPLKVGIGPDGLFPGEELGAPWGKS